MLAFQEPDQVPDELGPVEEDDVFQEPDPVPDELGQVEEDDVFQEPDPAANNIPPEGVITEVVIPETVFEEDIDEEVPDNKEELPQDGPERTHGMKTRGNDRSYGHRFVSDMDSPESGKSYSGVQLFQQAIEEIHSGELTGATKHTITGFLMNQMTMNAGIKNMVMLPSRQCSKSFSSSKINLSSRA